MFFRTCKNLLPRYSQLLSCRRRFNLQEYQSKILMNEYELAVQDFRIASSVEEAERIVAAFKPKLYVLKAQILAGGRKLGRFADQNISGIVFTADPNEVPIFVSQMIGNRLITKQTTAEGTLVNEVMIADAVHLKKERYLAILLDREACCSVVVTSSEGGVNIEDTAAKNPSAIKREYLDFKEGMSDAKSAKIASSLGFASGSDQHAVMCTQLKRLFTLFTELDCLQVEINPVGETVDGKLVNMDAKFLFDSNALYRQPRVNALAAKSRKLALEAAGESSPLALEMLAEAHGLNYISLPDGDIGCVVNGAGLAMATLDLLSLHGGKAANFLDLGGTANKAHVEVALHLLNSDKRVKCLLINIFGGIVNCQMVAEGIVLACRQNEPKVPVVVRLEGTNAVEGRQILKASGINLHIATNMEEAATLACGFTK